MADRTTLSPNAPTPSAAPVAARPRPALLEGLVMLGSWAAIAGVAFVALWSQAIDFRVYHEAAQRFLSGGNPYDFFGPLALPYQYAPWALGLVVPLAGLPQGVAQALFAALNGALLALLLRQPEQGLPHAPPRPIVRYALALLLAGLLFRVGQVSVLQALVMLAGAVAIERGRPTLAGVLVPCMVLKPQLVLLFLPALFWAGGWRTVRAAAVTSALVGLLSIWWLPSWPGDLLAVMQAGQQRNDTLIWNFTTLPALLGLPRSWNFLAAALLLPLGAALLVGLRRLERAFWLRLAMGLSLLAAPYSFAYDMPLIFPLLVWLTAHGAAYGGWLWALALGLTLISGYSSGVWLVFLLVVGVALWHARRMLRLGSGAE